ncbi:hypothetical protein FDI40_gp430 [Agrobacterium phage Atu_ph07]|uniref:Uncharacterized protein n=1 Tax=Agrobacterium phage Atu_ph07 TaxID=2024264 RepID=A0A2L0V082_9CAUD|nr:hypothetical protein FDI40_gp430 [Agrobacterium phage Atu_ph07]AUZ95189.1 hypothetical protein [Agrobacterium phage Atu_ph07]
MEFFDFIDAVSEDAFIFYDGHVFMVVFEKIDDYGSKSVDFTDIAPFVLNIPAQARSGRFSGRYGSYLSDKKNLNLYRQEGETVEAFLKRAMENLQ